jgi:hypothetical protein
VRGAARRLGAATLTGIVVLSACSRSEGGSAPAVPETVCWGALTGSVVATLLPNGTQAEVKVQQPFEVFVGRSHTYCGLRVDGKVSLAVWGDRKASGKGSDWNPLGKASTPIDVGDEGFVSQRGAAATFVCERPDLPRNQHLTPADKYVQLVLLAYDAPEGQKTRDTLASLMRQYVKFAKLELKCLN